MCYWSSAEGVHALSPCTCRVQENLSSLVQHVLRPLPPVPDERIARGHILTFEARQLTNSVWALATLGLHAPALYHAAARQLQLQIPRAADKALAAVADTYSQPIVRASTSASMPLLLTVLRSLRQRVAGGAVLPSTLAAVIWSASDPGAIAIVTSSLSVAPSMLDGRQHVLDRPDWSTAEVMASNAPGAHHAPGNDIQSAVDAVFGELAGLPAQVRRLPKPGNLH
jgi:hypothetical protein